MGGGAKVRQFEGHLGLVDEDVVGLDVGVDDAGLLEDLQRQQHLLHVGPHRLDVQTHVLAVLLQHLPQVHAQRLEHHA